MKLSRTVTYALKATLQLAQNTKGGPVPCSRLAAQGGMPERFLLQILRSLVTHGILKSTRGVDGGYVLLREPEEVSLLDVIEAIEGPLTHEIAIGEGLPESSRQKLSDVLVEVTQATLSKLSSVKLADLICPPEEFAAMLSQRDQDPSNDGLRTRIDEPSSVPQTPKATPEINPAPAATPNMNSPSVPPAMPTSSIPPAHSPAPHVGPTNSLPSINPNSGASL